MFERLRHRDLGKVGHPAAVWLFQLGIEQPQDNDIDAVTFTCRPNNWLNVLPSRRCDGHGGQATERAAVGCHQHQLCGSGLCHHRRLWQRNLSRYSPAALNFSRAAGLVSAARNARAASRLVLAEEMPPT